VILIPVDEFMMGSTDPDSGYFREKSEIILGE
jgi:hypothetical protein